MSLSFDFGDFERVAARMMAAADQIPFALAGSLNEASNLARRELIEQTWPSHMQVRNARFMAAALTTKGTRATKKNLRVEIYDRLGRGSLALHEQGGVKRPRGASLAIPSKSLQGSRNSKGIPAGLRPKALPQSFRKGDAIYQRTGGKGKSRGLKLMYTLKPGARITADVPFHQDFETVMRREVGRAFGPRLWAAMATRASKRGR